MKVTEEMERMAKSFQRGEEKGFTFFYNLFLSELCFFAFKFLNDRDLAKDKVDESFIKIWSMYHTFTHPIQIKQWLYTTVKNLCMREFQYEKYNNKKLEGLKVISDDTDMPYAEIMEAKIREILLRDLVNRTLPEKCAEIFILMFFDNYTAAEIAQILGISISSVKTQKGIGLERLRKKFGTTKEKYEANNHILFEKIKNSPLKYKSIGALYGTSRSMVKSIKLGMQKKLYV